MEQAEDRVHRIGQTSNSVNVYYLYGEGTIDSLIFPKLKFKSELLAKTLDGKNIRYSMAQKDQEELKEEHYQRSLPPPPPSNSKISDYFNFVQTPRKADGLEVVKPSPLIESLYKTPNTNKRKKKSANVVRNGIWAEDVKFVPKKSKVLKGGALEKLLKTDSKKRTQSEDSDSSEYSLHSENSSGPENSKPRKNSKESEESKESKKSKKSKESKEAKESKDAKEYQELKESKEGEINDSSLLKILYDSEISDSEEEEEEEDGSEKPSDLKKRSREESRLEANPDKEEEVVISTYAKVKRVKNNQKYN